MLVVEAKTDYPTYSTETGRRHSTRQAGCCGLAGRAAVRPVPADAKRFDGGVDLSGGEWRKVALARAYMRDAQLLILDEPTAALDARAEYEVFLRFRELTEGRMPC